MKKIHRDATHDKNQPSITKEREGGGQREREILSSINKKFPSIHEGFVTLEINKFSCWMPQKGFFLGLVWYDCLNCKNGDSGRAIQAPCY